MVQWLTLAACYLALTGSPSLSEFVAAALVGLTGVLVVPLVRHCSRQRITVRAPWLRLAGRMGVALLRDTWRVTGVLARTILRGHSGRLLHQHGAVDRYPGGSEPERRAVAALQESIAPNALVVDAEGQDLWVHRLG